MINNFTFRDLYPTTHYILNMKKSDNRDRNILLDINYYGVQGGVK
jgi:hypothetical protein